MPIPEPFTATALGAGVLTNLASDILKHRAQALEDTLAGRMLKWAGLIDPNFNDRLQDAIARALKLYFEAYPQYQISGIMSFFEDPSVGNLIGSYILDRQPINEDDVRQALEAHFGGDPISAIYMSQKGLNPQRIIPDFLECYRKVLNRQLSVPQMAIMLEILEQTDTVIIEIRASEERMKDVVQQTIQRMEQQDETLDQIAEDIEVIKQHLGISQPQTVIVAEIQAALAAAPRGAMFETGGLCSGYPLHPMPSHYFVAQEFSPDRDDLRGALADALTDFDVQTVRADDLYWPGHILCKISALIQSTPFGVYQLTASQNRNIYLELGIAIGLGKPFVLVKDKNAEIANLIQGIEYYQINSYLETRYELGELLRPFVANIGSYRPQTLPQAGSRKTAVIAHGGLEAIDFCVTVAKILHNHGLMPVILGDPDGRISKFLSWEEIPHQIVGDSEQTLLEESINAIQASRLGIYRIDKKVNPSALVTLGVSMGLNRPGLLLHKNNSEPPSDLKGLNPLIYQSYTNLSAAFPQKFGHLLRRYSYPE